MLTLAASLCMACGNREADNETQIDTECIAETPTEQPVEIVEKSTEKVAEEITTELKEVRDTENKTVVVCIDPGHGGEGDNNHGVGIPFTADFNANY